MFKLHTSYQPMGDQPQAIDALTNNLKNGVKYQTLLGATGTGKTFTIANVIKEINKQMPTYKYIKDIILTDEERKELISDSLQSGNKGRGYHLKYREA